MSAIPFPRPRAIRSKVMLNKPLASHRTHAGNKTAARTSAFARGRQCTLGDAFGAGLVVHS
jgi:hypothetical protein